MASAPDPFLASNVTFSGTTQEELRRGALAAASRPDVVLIQYGQTRFPNICPNCGETAHRTLEVSRAGQVYVYNSDGPNEWFHEIEKLQIGFCEKCIAQHFRGHLPPSPWLNLKRIFGGGLAGEALGAIIAGGVAFFFFKEAVLKLSLALLLFSAWPGAIAFWLLRRNWRRNAYMAVPKPSDVTSAVEFTPNLAADYEPGWRAFRFRHVPYAAQFRAVNAGSVWDPQGTTAREAQTKRRVSSARQTRIIIIVVVILALFGLWSEYGQFITDLIDRLR